MKVWFVLCTVLVGCGTRQTPSPGGRPHTFVEYVEPSVLVVALGVEALTRELRDVQLQIVAKAARNGPVLVLATSSEQQARLHESCARYDDLCTRIHDSTVRIVVEPHQGPWIRDYGPFMTMDGSGTMSVVDAKYDDARRRLGLEYRREMLNEERRKLLEKKIGSGDDDSVLFREREQSLLRYGAELAQLLKDDEDLRQRAMDDDAPFYVAQAGLGNEHFSLMHSSIYLDGGNLFLLQDGTCLTTTDTVAKNGGDRRLVERELGSLYHCGRVVFLEALPGEGIIKHIDMFLMPVLGKTILLATYAPDSTRFPERFGALDGELRELVKESAIAMQRDKLHLQQLGYHVVDVPSLFPQQSAGTVYFPTLLNGIIQVGRDGRRHLLLPDYATDSDDDVVVKQDARAVFQATFGRDVDIQSIESTIPAKLQGALHCLTNTIPLSGSLFAQDDKVFNEMNDQFAKVPPRLPAVSTHCLDQMLGDWQQLNDLSDRHSGNIVGSSIMTIEKNMLRLRGDGDASYHYTASCIAKRPNEALLQLEVGSDVVLLVTLHHDGDTLETRFESGNHYTFMRPAALQQRAQRLQAPGRDTRAETDDDDTDDTDAKGQDADKDAKDAKGQDADKDAKDAKGQDADKDDH